MLNIIQDFIPKGRLNRPGRINPMKFITIHNTGNAGRGANAKAHANYIKSDAAAERPASWHYTVDEFGAYQHLPDNEDAFHAGDGGGNGNRQSIGIEICMNSDGDLLKATDNAALLTADLCKKYGIPIQNIRQHFNWSGKNCPQMIRARKPYDWDTFIDKVKMFLEPIKEDEKEMTQEKFNGLMDVYLRSLGAMPPNKNIALTEFEQAKAAGITDGTRPQDFVTRQEAAVMAFRAAKKY